MAGDRGRADGQGLGLTGDTLLLRQVHPAWVHRGRVTSQVFRPTPKDQKKLSAYDGDQITAANAWAHFTSVLGLVSVGVLAVSARECQSLGLIVVPEPTLFLEHVFIDFTPFIGNDVQRKAKQLKAFADSRG